MIKTTVNLETVLRRQHANAIVSAKELLAVKQYDRLSIQSTTDALRRSGLNKVMATGEKVKAKIADVNASIAQFPADRVFHISQIEKLANKYRLKFLKTELYRGDLPDELGGIMIETEIKYGITFKPETTFIMAPPSAFELQERPEDPLLFHQIEKDHYYLVHKWGNDLSVFRAFWHYVNPVAVLILFAAATGIFAAMSVYDLIGLKAYTPGDEKGVKLFFGFLGVVAGLIIGCEFLPDDHEYNTPIK